MNVSYFTALHQILLPTYSAMMEKASNFIIITTTTPKPIYYFIVLTDIHFIALQKHPFHKINDCQIFFFPPPFGKQTKKLIYILPITITVSPLHDTIFKVTHYFSAFKHDYIILSQSWCLFHKTTAIREITKQFLLGRNKTKSHNCNLLIKQECLHAVSHYMTVRGRAADIL